MEMYIIEKSTPEIIAPNKGHRGLSMHAGVSVVLLRGLSRVRSWKIERRTT